ncbi:MAG: FprA family A-type flavoprotein [Clostridiales Family XIII bacterium]|jgi:flavorubredoxin|nr:FprA family A-type flavoprotein [Clostridiales Family XIII bacterium]
MQITRKVTDDLYWVGTNEHRLHLFENIHPIPRGVSYNAYLLFDEKTCLFDTVDWAGCRQFLENVEGLLNGKPLDYLLINHLEPDHAASIDEILVRHPETKVISNEKAFMLMHQYGFHIDGEGRQIEVKEGDTFSFGTHTVTFVAAPMVHWPEAMVTLDLTNGVLFSADAFGTFGATDGHLWADEVPFKESEWLDDARRYLVNIVGKYGPHIQLLLGKASTVLDKIKIVAPLHGPLWKANENLLWFIGKYDKWSKYEPEEQGILVIYSSMYGNTEAAIMNLTNRLSEKGFYNYKVYDVSSTHVSYLISETFKYSHIVLGAVTYNLGIYPPMHDYLMDLKALNVQKRTFAIIENGSWAPKAGDLIEEFLNDELKEMTVLSGRVTVNSSVNESGDREIEDLADSLIESVNEG